MKRVRELFSMFFGTIVLFFAELKGAIKYRFSSKYRLKILERSLNVSLDSADPVYLTEYDYESKITHEKDLTYKASFHRIDFAKQNERRRKNLEMLIERENYTSNSWELSKDGESIVFVDDIGNIFKTINIPKDEVENSSSTALEVKEDGVDIVIRGEDGNVVKTISFPKNDKGDN